MAVRLRDKTLLTVILGILILGMILVGSVTVPAVTAQSRTGESIQNDMRVVYLAAQTDQPVASIPAPSQMRLNSPQSANINVTYNGAWPAAAMTAFDFAVTIWEGLITSGVTIEVDATWAPLGGPLGAAGANTYMRNFAGAPVASTWYPSALADKLFGSDLNPGQPDIDAIFASDFSDWYFGTDASPPVTQWDFVTVVLHELGHGLGFAGSMRVDGTCGGGLGCWGFVGDAQNDPAIYDRFSENGGGTPLLNFTNFSTALATELQGGDIFFDGANANAANGGTPPELYAPGTWEQGSSYSHLDETVFNGTPHALMTPVVFNGEALHNPGTVTLGMFQDMGWMLDGGSPTPTPTVTPTATPGGPPTPVAYNYLPVALKDVSLSAPLAGFWEGPFDSFYVTPNQASVIDFTSTWPLPGCGIQDIVNPATMTITNNQFSSGGSFIVNGMFTSPISATGTVELDNHFVPVCGASYSGGPFGWGVDWKDASQPPLQAALQGEVRLVVEPATLEVRKVYKDE